MELGHLLGVAGAAVAVVAAAVTAVAVPRLWAPVRRLVAVIDALAGRPARYDGDEEARPGLVERLDGFDARFDRVDHQLRCVDGRVTRIEQATTGGNGDVLRRSPDSHRPPPGGRQ